jgi:hypothetical protein
MNWGNLPMVPQVSNTSTHSELSHSDLPGAQLGFCSTSKSCIPTHVAVAPDQKPGTGGCTNDKSAPFTNRSMSRRRNAVICSGLLGTTIAKLSPYAPKCDRS